jgi:hypothetical protein
MLTLMFAMLLVADSDCDRMQKARGQSLVHMAVELAQVGGGKLTASCDDRTVTLELYAPMWNPEGATAELKNVLCQEFGWSDWKLKAHFVDGDAHQHDISVTCAR